MASTYSDLKIELIGTGDQSGTWGATTNTNLGTALEEAIVGRATANFTTDADLTITLSNVNTTQVARNYILNVTSGVALTATRNLIVPTIDKPYIVENNTTGSQSIVVKTSAGTGITVPTGKTVMVYANGTNVVQAFDYVPSVTVGTVNITSLTAGSITDSGLTAGRVTYAGTAGLLADSASLTFDGTTLSTTTVDTTNLEVTNLKAKDGTAAGSIANSTGVVTIASSVLTTTDINGGTIDATSIGATTPSTAVVTSLTDSGLTSGRVTYASTGGLLADSANLTFNGTTLTANNDASISGLTVGKGGGAVATNTAVGFVALPANTTGAYNTAIGYGSLNLNTIGNYNIAVGSATASSNAALGVNTSGGNNVAVGTGALGSNTTASNNTAVGYQAGYSNAGGTNGTYLGYQAGYTTTASGFVGIGYKAGYVKSGSDSYASVMVGNEAGVATTSGLDNTFVGGFVARTNTTGSNNTALGTAALYSNTTGGNNVAIGYLAGRDSTGGSNCYVGYASGYLSNTGTKNNFFGWGSGAAIGSGSKNTIIGGYDGNQGGLDIRTASNYIVLSDGDGNAPMYYNPVSGWQAKVSLVGEYAFTLTNSSSAGYGYFSNLNNSSSSAYRHFTGYSASTSTYNYYVFSNGNVANTNNSYGAISDIKLKENIVDATPKLEDLCKVKIRQYNLKSDPSQKQIGVIAQELEEIFPAMINECEDQDSNGNNLGTVTKQVKYSVFVPMLIKAIQELKAEIDLLKGTK